MTKIAPTETVIAGRWIPSNQGTVREDANCQRIALLIRTHLKELGRDRSGWDALYRDPDDGRLWELVYARSDQHGGGPPELRNLRTDEAIAKYGADAVKR